MLYILYRNFLKSTPQIIVAHSNVWEPLVNTLLKNQEELAIKLLFRNTGEKSQESYTKTHRITLLLKNDYHNSKQLWTIL